MSQILITFSSCIALTLHFRMLNCYYTSTTTIDMLRPNCRYERVLEPSSEYQLSPLPTSSSFSQTTTQGDISEHSEEFLPPKQFLNARKPVWKRAIWQAFLGVSFLVVFLAVGPLFITTFSSSYAS